MVLLLLEDLMLVDISNDAAVLFFTVFETMESVTLVYCDIHVLLEICSSRKHFLETNIFINY